MSTFKEKINSSVPTLVDVYATWCGPCKMMPPVLNDVKKKLGEAVNIVKVDIDKNQAYAQKNNIQSVPTLLIYKEGEILWKQPGVLPAHQIISEIKKHI